MPLMTGGFAVLADDFAFETLHFMKQSYTKCSMGQPWPTAVVVHTDFYRFDLGPAVLLQLHCMYTLWNLSCLLQFAGICYILNGAAHTTIVYPVRAVCDCSDCMQVDIDWHFVAMTADAYIYLYRIETVQI